MKKIPLITALLCSYMCHTAYDSQSIIKKSTFDNETRALSIHFISGETVKVQQLSNSIEAFISNDIPFLYYNCSGKKSDLGEPLTIECNLRVFTKKKQVQYLIEIAIALFEEVANQHIAPPTQDYIAPPFEQSKVGLSKSY